MGERGRKAGVTNRKRGGSAALAPSTVPRSVAWRVDQDYVSTLAPKHKEWLAQFNDRFYGADFRGESEVTWSTDERREVYRAKNRANRDLMTVDIPNHGYDVPEETVEMEEAIALDGDELMAIAAEAMLRKGTLKQNTLAVTVMSNYGLDDLVSRLGGRVIRTGVGDRYVLEEMRSRGLNLGGEQSGHIIFGDWATTGDGLIAGLQVLRIMKETGEPLSQLRKCLKKFPQSSRNLRVRTKPPIEELVEAQKIMKETEKKLGDYGRVLLRYSGTESLIRLLVEGRDVEYLEAQADKIASAILAQIG